MGYMIVPCKYFSHQLCCLLWWQGFARIGRWTTAQLITKSGQHQYFSYLRPRSLKFSWVEKKRPHQSQEQMTLQKLRFAFNYTMTSNTCILCHHKTWHQYGRKRIEMNIVYCFFIGFIHFENRRKIITTLQKGLGNPILISKMNLQNSQMGKSCRGLQILDTWMGYPRSSLPQYGDILY